jgi:hypothetical protein
MGVLEGDHAGTRKVAVIGFDRRLDVFDRQRPIRLVGYRLRLDRAEYRRAAGLVHIEMGLLPGDEFVATPAMAHQRQQIGLGA